MQLKEIIFNDPYHGFVIQTEPKNSSISIEVKQQIIVIE